MKKATKNDIILSYNIIGYKIDKVSNSLDVIIPVRNEAKNISKLIYTIHEVLQRARITHSLIIIDDHSTDDTARLVKFLTDRFPIQYYLKKGSLGKGYSILEGVKYATAPYIAMIDADMQYHPRHLKEMMSIINVDSNIGAVVANRKTYHSGLLRRAGSRACALIFGKLLFGIDTDVQSGLKIFRRDIISHLDIKNVGPWSFDIPLLVTVLDLGYKIGSIQINFDKRENGESKISIVHTAFDIAQSALRLRLTKKHTYHIAAHKDEGALGSGLIHRRRQFITHTTLPHQLSALNTLNSLQKILLIIIVTVLILGVVFNIHKTAVITLGILSAIYFVDVIFNLIMVLRSLRSDNEVSISHEALEKIDDKTLPVYTILCPLYREAHMVPQFVRAISALDWPKDKLDVKILLEEDDVDTIAAAKGLNLPAFISVLIVPHSEPRTKPKAANYGLQKARGEFVVIYDAEDIPDPQQLKKVYLGFQKLSANVICLQAKLNYYNPHHNLLTRLFTAEYSLWFDIFLTGLQSFNTAIPLGGTSNHFKKTDLIVLQGWDPFNVTEDCDLGARLFKKGYKTAIIDSTTLEEANSRVGNWLRQRSRWIKGYIQTYFVHMREPISFLREHGRHALFFQLVVGGKIGFMFINPILWAATISYFAFYAVVGPAIESLYPPIVFYLALISLVFGNFLFIYYYMIGVAKRRQWDLMKYIFLVPIYWLMVSTGALIAVFQLIFKPHYWEKTVHGYHLIARENAAPHKVVYDSGARFGKVKRYVSKYYTSGMLVLGIGLGSVLNFIYAAYLGRILSLSDFALVSFISGLLGFISILSSSLGAAINHRASFLIGKYDRGHAHRFWHLTRNESIKRSLLLAVMWMICSPFLVLYFKTETIFPILFFAPIIIVGFPYAIDRSYLSANLNFGLLAILAVVEPLIRLMSAVLLVQLNLSYWTFSAIPFSVIAAFFLGWLFVKKDKIGDNVQNKDQRLFTFPNKFFFASLLSGLSTVSFLSLDTVMAKHYLTADDAGLYSLSVLVAKMIFFLGALISPFIMPLVSRGEGTGKDTGKILNYTVIATLIVCLPGFAALGIFGDIIVPMLFGSKVVPALPFIPLLSLGALCLTIARVYAEYYLAKKQYSFSFVAFLIGLLQLVILTLFHSDVRIFVYAVSGTWIGYFITTMLLHFFSQQVKMYENALIRFIQKKSIVKESVLDEKSKQRILIFNWRDTRHAWAGGAELYIHELAKRWVRAGHAVTVFCGNDTKSPTHETVDGVRIIRRGGFFTVYLWAVYYYLFKLRGNFDIVVDSENGIPFFTPLYVRVPKFLLIHHVHQEVFRKHLIFPFSVIAMFIESQLMPILYRNQKIITVSESSKKDILHLGFTKPDFIEVIPPGVDLSRFSRKQKTLYPSFVYLGRLKPYKNVDVIIRAFAKIAGAHPGAKLYIAGEGESEIELKKLAAKTGLNGAITFLGRVDEKTKGILLAKCWAALQPSSIEGFGITVIEANATGTPVIASNVSGLRDSVIDGRTGFLVKPKDVNSFAERMEHLVARPDVRKKVSDQAYAWAQQLSWEKSAEIFYQNFREETKKIGFNYSSLAVSAKQRV